MNEVIKALQGRHSIRKYQKKQIPDEVLEQILLGGACSPNAGNRQTTRIVVCQNAEINDRLGRLKKQLSHVKLSTPDRYISKEQPSIADDPTLPSAFYQAPTVITLFGPKNFWFKNADCYIMANNICLAAHSLGVGSCIVGCVEDIFANEYGQKLLKEWQIPEEFEAVTHITLGYLDGPAPSPKPKKYVNPVIVR